MSNQVTVANSLADAVDEEQDFLSVLYGKVDDLREQAQRRLAQALKETGGTHQARYERNATMTRHADQITQFDAVEEGLCFGRLDFDDGELCHIGRIGIFDDANGYEPLLLDWRAPASRPFYVATAASPEGVRRRRHIRTRGREVTAVDEEVLDLATAKPEGLTGEAALLAAVNASRTGRMTDIVQTIQAEQDTVIRSELRGVLVVQGGPGTGKTAVALHRAAYLLYTYRRQLAKRGVLVIGPNETFLKYVSQVLPSLAETDVLLRTVGELFPGVTATRTEPPQVAEIKGRPAMRKVIANAVADRQRIPEEALEVTAEIGLGNETLRLDRAMCEQARHKARRSRRPHNLARPIFVREMIKSLTRQLTRRLGDDPYGGGNLLDERDVAQLRQELRDSTALYEALDSLWPTLTPQRLLTDLYASGEALASAAPRLKAADRALLERAAAAGDTPDGDTPDADTFGGDAPDGGWTPADAPLLDEAAELLGVDDRAERAQAERRRRQQREYAEGVLDLMEGSRSFDFEGLEKDDAEVLVAMDLLGAEHLAERHEEIDYRTTAERAAEDRTWAYGHIIVDEAQELSPMAWRMVMRRCPARSMTIVGDVAQTGDPGGASSWQRVVEPYASGRWRTEELTISYRTPSEIMELAGGVLAEIDPSLTVPRAVRSTGVPPVRLSATADRLAATTAEVAATESTEVGDGRVGVIVPAGRADELAYLVMATVPGTAVGSDPGTVLGHGREAPSLLRNPVVLLTVRQAKGLEFDSVVVVDPERIVAESPRGRNDLYVALTRATQRLTIVEVGQSL
ncbi:MAG: HelD family protein [Micromonosporaceae bacterium]